MLQDIGKWFENIGKQIDSKVGGVTSSFDKLKPYFNLTFWFQAVGALAALVYIFITLKNGRKK